MEFFAGVDVGSLTTKAVILGSGDRVLGWSMLETGANSTTAAEAAMAGALERAGLVPGDLTRVVSTGYGRGSVPFAHRAVTEITCHARGAGFLFPGAGTVVDVGGQDSKVISLGTGGKVLDFSMNDKCAAGTGRFLEVMAAKLQVGLDRMGPLSLEARGEASISSVCTVFAETEVVSLVARNHPTEEIVRGIHRSIVTRIAAMLRGIGVREQVVMTGGVARNSGVVALLEEQIEKRVLVPQDPQSAGALGAALIAAGSW